MSVQDLIVKGHRWLCQLKSRMVRNTKASYGLAGTMGTSLIGGLLTEEYLGDLQDLATRCGMYEKMRKTEPAVNLSLLCYELPLLSAHWGVHIDKKDIEANEVPEERRNEILSFVKANLFEQMNRPWSKVMREGVSYLQNGCSVMELVWEKAEGQVWLVDIVNRALKTIVWEFDDDQNLISVGQQNVDKMGIKIPREKLLILTNDGIGANLEGVGMCRYQYRAWKMKYIMMKLIMIGFERFLVGDPIVETPLDQREGDNAKIKEMFKYWASSEKGGKIVPAGWKIRIDEMNFTGSMTAMKFIEFLNREMFWACMVHFVLLGLSGQGSLALSRDQTDLFLMALQSKLNEISDVFNYDVIPQMVRFNFKEEIFPKLGANVQEEDLQLMLTNVTKLVGSGVIPKYGALRDLMIQRMNLPEFDESDEIIDDTTEEPQEGKEGENDEAGKEHEKAPSGKDGDIQK